MSRARRVPQPGSACDRHRDALAQRYAMGLLGPSATRAFQSWMSHDARLQAQVRSWEHTLAKLSMHVPPMVPSSALWKRIRAALPAERGAPASRDASWWQRLWHASSVRMACAACAGVLTCAIVAPQLAPVKEEGSVPASYVGVLTNTADQPALVVASLRHSRQVQIKLLQPIKTSDGSVPVLWALAPGESPRAIARLPDHGKASLPILTSAESSFARVTRLAVSLEPGEVASTSALPAYPTQAYLLMGHCAKVW